MHTRTVRNVKLGVIKVLLVVLVFPVDSVIYYRQRPPPPYLPRYVRQTPYFVNAQSYVAVPGRIVQHFNAGTVPFRTVPTAPIQNVQVPLVSPLLQSYYELESDPSSSNPDNNNGQEDSNGGGGLEPPPPPESEDPPPMMDTMQPPPPPPEDNNDNNDDSPPPPPPYPHVHKHISIHAPPEEMESDEDQVTVIRPKIPGPEKHVNIIFIKAPSMKSQKKKTEVILPNTPEQKTLVYVLVRKPDPANDGTIRIRGPKPTEPPKPKVYYIRYKQHNKDHKGYVYTDKKQHSHYHR